MKSMNLNGLSNTQVSTLTLLSFVQEICLFQCHGLTIQIQFFLIKTQFVSDYITQKPLF